MGNMDIKDEASIINSDKNVVSDVEQGFALLFRLEWHEEPILFYSYCESSSSFLQKKD